MPEPELFYYFTPTKYALEAVKNHRLKAAELDKANNPYELMPIRWDNPTDEQISQRVKSDLSQVLKMICFSKTYKDPSLWGHYANRCKGICLGFDIKTLKGEGIDPIDNIREVTYEEEKKDMSEFGFRFIGGIPFNTEGKTHTMEPFAKLWSRRELLRVRG